MIHLDTHVVLWLRAGRFDLIPHALRDRLDREELAVSPMVHLELAYLHEIGRSTESSELVLAEARRGFGLTTDSADFSKVTDRAAQSDFAFTRDPFDRLIAAQAEVAGADLATRDGLLRKHLRFAVWD